MQRLMLNSQGRIIHHARGEYVEYSEVLPLLTTAARLLERENHILLYDEVSQFLQALRLQHHVPS